MKVVIVEDEIPAATYLSELLMEINPSINIIQTIHTVKDSLVFFREIVDIDLVFMDVELSDGVSISIFNQLHITAPVIFTTGHREYSLEAFKMNGIDYILKPINAYAVNQALEKYNSLRQKIVSTNNVLLKLDDWKATKKSILVAKKGVEFCLLKTSQIVCLYSENFIVFAIDTESKKFIIETSNLAKLEEELDSVVFFRANRKYLVNINFIRSYKIIERVKLQLELSIFLKNPIIIGQERSKEFKQWLRSH